MAERYTAIKFRWLYQVVQDRELGHFAARTGVVLSKYFSEEAGGEAWPQQATLAASFGATARGVRNALDELESRKHLRVAFRAEGQVNRYQPLVWSGGPEAAPQAFVTIMFGGDGPTVLTPGGDAVALEVEADDHVSGTAVPVARGTTVPPEPYKETNIDIPREPRNGDASERSQEARREDAALSVGRAFERFWLAYPRKDSRDDARRVFVKVVSKGEVDAETLIRCATRYAGRVAGRAPEMVKFATTWLSKANWADDIDDGKPVFAGPPALRSAIASGDGEAFAGSYLDPCSWDGETRTLTPRTSIAYDRLREQRLRTVFVAHNVTLARPATAGRP